MRIRSSLMTVGILAISACRTRPVSVVVPETECVVKLGEFVDRVARQILVSEEIDVRIAFVRDHRVDHAPQERHLLDEAP